MHAGVRAHSSVAGWLRWQEGTEEQDDGRMSVWELQSLLLCSSAIGGLCTRAYAARAHR